MGLGQHWPTRFYLLQPSYCDSQVLYLYLSMHEVTRLTSWESERGQEAALVYDIPPAQPQVVFSDHHVRRTAYRSHSAAATPSCSTTTRSMLSRSLAHDVDRYTSATP